MALNFFTGGGDGCFHVMVVFLVGGCISCNSMFQKMLPLIGMINLMHERGNHTLNFVTSREVLWHQTYTHYSVIQLVMDGAVLTTR